MKTRKRGITHGVNLGSDYTPDEIEWLMAMDRYMRHQGSRCPSWPEVLQVAKSLGYRKEQPELVKEH